MKAAETARLLDDVSVVMRSFVEQAIGPLTARLGALEKRLAELPVPRDGKDGIDGKDGKDGRDGIDGKDGEPGKDGVNGRDGSDGIDGKDGAPGLHGKDGEPGKDGVNGRDGSDGIDGKDGADGLNGKDGRDGIDGKDAAPTEVAAILSAEFEPALKQIESDLAALREPVGELSAVVEAAVAKHIAAAVDSLPKPQDGKSVTLDDVRPLIDDAVTNAVGAMPPPRDGVGLADALIDRSGSLVLTLTDGSMRNLGGVVGKDGSHGIDGKDGAPGTDGRDGVAGRDGSDGIDGKDGAPGLHGKDGVDGLSVEDLSHEYDGERRLVLRFTRGDVNKEIVLNLPIPIYRGVFDKSAQYMRGDVVTFNGSAFIAVDDPPEGHPEASKGWKLSVKRGRDGKEAVSLPRDPKAPVKVGDGK